MRLSGPRICQLRQRRGFQRALFHTMYHTCDGPTGGGECGGLPGLLLHSATCERSCWCSTQSERKPAGTVAASTRRLLTGVKTTDTSPPTPNCLRPPQKNNSQCILLVSPSHPAVTRRPSNHPLDLQRLHPPPDRPSRYTNKRLPERNPTLCS